MGKFIKILTYAIMAISVVLLVYFLMDPNRDRTGIFLIWSYILLGLAIVLAIAGPVFNIASNPKSLKMVALNIGFIVVLFGLAYVLSSSEQTTATAAMQTPPTEKALRITDMGIYATYILLALAFASIVCGSVYTAIKNRA